MLALSYSQHGDPSVLRLSEVPEPHAGPGQVRIVVRTAAVNPADTKFRAGLMGGALPAVSGLEAAGVVDEVGEGITGFAVGDEVFGLGSNTAAQYAVLDSFAPKPAAATWDEAGGMSLGPETALRGLRLLGLKPGETLLIEGAAGSVGSAAAQFAVNDGIAVIGTAGPANHDRLKALGVIPTTYGPGLPERVRALASKGVQGALDTAGKGALPDLIELVGAPDRVVTVADFSGGELGVHVSGDRSAFDALPLVADLVSDGKFVVAVDSVYPLAEAAKAHQRSESGHLNGKVILKVSDA